MECEICGNIIKGLGVKIKVEGVVMTVCDACSDLGEKVRIKTGSRYLSDSLNKRNKISKTVKKPKVMNARMTRRPTHKKRELEIEKLELVDDYIAVIKRARGRMTLEEFANRLNEKASVIQKIETKKLKPTIKLARKIEKLFHVKLLVNTDEDDEYFGIAWKFKDKERYEPTLGDFIKNKKK
ncbi:MAG: multiprotein bridging factor aMBF1 [Promethearchaeota archaeon]